MMKNDLLTINCRSPLLTRTQTLKLTLPHSGFPSLVTTRTQPTMRNAVPTANRCHASVMTTVKRTCTRAGWSQWHSVWRKVQGLSFVEQPIQFSIDREESLPLHDLVNRDSREAHSIVSTLLRSILSSSRAMAKHALLACRAETHTRSKTQKQRYMKREKIQAAHRTKSTAVIVNSRQLSPRNR